MANSNKYKCTKCGAIHGGVDSTTLCHECYMKGKRRFTVPIVTIVAILALIPLFM